MYWKLAFTNQYTWLNSPDGANLILPWFQMQAVQMHRFALALWDPHQWCGQPLIGQGQAGTAYPFNWILWAMPLAGGVIQNVYLNWYFILIHCQAAVFMYWLCRSLQRSVGASIFAGLAFTVGPLLGVVEWPGILNASAWAPLLLLFFCRVLRDERANASAAACGAVLGVAWLSGNSQVPLLLTLFAASLWIWLSLRTRRWKPPLIFAIAACGVSAFQALPTMEYLAHAPAAWTDVPTAAWKANTVSPLSLPGIVAPGYESGAVLFAGWTVISFAVIGFWSAWRDEIVRIMAAAAVVGLLLAFGSANPFAGMLYGLDALAQNAKCSLLFFTLGTALIAAFGVDSVSGSRAVGHTAIALAAISAVCWVATLLLILTSGADFKLFNPLALCALAASLVAALLEAARRGAISSKSMAVLAILIAMWEFGNVAGANWRNVESGWAYLAPLADKGNVSKPNLPFLSGDWFGTEEFDGVTGGTHDIVRVRHAGDARDLARGGPRAWIIHDLRSISDDDATVRRSLRTPAEDLRAHGFLTGPAPKLETCDGVERASVVSARPRRIRLRTLQNCRAMVVLAETWYPGWSVAVDGRSAPLYRAYGFLQSTVAPAGTHEITFTYRPWSAWIGGALTFLSLVLTVLWQRFGQRGTEGG